MNTGFAKSPAFSFTVRACLKPTCLNQCHASSPQSFWRSGSLPKPHQNPISACIVGVSLGFRRGSHEKSCFLKRNGRSAAGSYHELAKTGGFAGPRSVLSGSRVESSVQCCSLRKGRNFSSVESPRVGDGSGVIGAGKVLPWLATKDTMEVKRSVKVYNRQADRRSGESTRKLHKGPNSRRVGDMSGATRAGKAMPWLASKKPKEVVRKQTSHSSWEESARKLQKEGESTGSSWVQSAKQFDGKKGSSRMNRADEIVGTDVSVSKQADHTWRHDDFGKLEEGEDVEDEVEEAETIEDPRWDAIRTRVRGVVDVKLRTENPRLTRWNKQEDWGRKTWKEASESSLPRLVGEGVYGVGPVLAALSAGRREYYTLYVQEGLDLSSNNKKKKDKKGFGKVLRMAEKIGVSIKEASKHDLNMVVDNRPHQGLVLDASPLEMVKIMELDPVSLEDEGSLWVALDEVTDPQNLGAIIRSAYFFGASGVVLCAKNSAPLSGVVSKASAGSLELTELRYCKNMMQFLASSAENGWRVLGGSVSSKSVPVNDVAPGVPTILVLGSEGTGLRPLVERSCNQLIRIPGKISLNVTAGEANNAEEGTETNNSAEEFRSFLAVESLNVSVAAGVLLHHLIGGNYGKEPCEANELTD
ncbi:hypothetical protein BT93_L2035 [Corymbia citriodora subsp. variegata]|uniref:rRNA methyltransferase 1, mitochondrial n=1 Tax=Corymbia citriodora subsp. variegata TaxID=360336 RepID=A0A8T0CZW5_CORYI|nr:hypothetical protein BT93_L2035 [Corymbia citriodora subsp. variegata]